MTAKKQQEDDWFDAVLGDSLDACGNSQQDQWIGKRPMKRNLEDITVDEFVMEFGPCVDLDDVRNSAPENFFDEPIPSSDPREERERRHRLEQKWLAAAYEWGDTTSEFLKDKGCLVPTEVVVNHMTQNLPSPRPWSGSYGIDRIESFAMNLLRYMVDAGRLISAAVSDVKPDTHCCCRRWTRAHPIDVVGLPHVVEC